MSTENAGHFVSDSSCYVSEMHLEMPSSMSSILFRLQCVNGTIDIAGNVVNALNILQHLRTITSQCTIPETEFPTHEYPYHYPIGTYNQLHPFTHELIHGSIIPDVTHVTNRKKDGRLESHTKHGNYLACITLQVQCDKLQA